MDLPDLSSAIKEFRRILKPGGRVVFSILHPCFPWKDSKFHDGRVVYAWKSSYFDIYQTSLPPFAEEFDTDFIVFHRPLSEYINLALLNGFAVVGFEEPRVEFKYKENMNQDLFERLRITPASIVIELRKENIR
jgi:SAM-dependent methyltransferase